MTALPGAEESVTVSFGLLFDVALYVSLTSTVTAALVHAHQDDPDLVLAIIDLTNKGRGIAAQIAGIAAVERARNNSHDV